nr:MAG TPA: hypothetical protein [Caudoviricetes sp.]
MKLFFCFSCILTIHFHICNFFLLFLNSFCSFL